jgi:hypothetical protein
MTEFRTYLRKSAAELRPFIPGEGLLGVSVAEVDIANGSPQLGDMIARNPKNHADQWLIAEAYFKENFLSWLTYRAGEGEAVDALTALQTAIEKYLAGDYPNPRQNRPGTCEHDVNYWQQCEACNDNFLSAALAASRKPGGMKQC